MSIRIDFDACIGCGTCAENCTFGALEFDGEKPVYNVEKCTSCSLCVDNCPVKALSMEEEFGEGEPKDLVLTLQKPARRPHA